MATGLTSEEAAERLRRYGPNLVSRPPRRPLWGRAARSLREPLVLVLLAAAVLTSLTGDLPDTAVILLVVVVNTSVAVWQEVRSDRAVAALSSLAAPTTHVVRDGRRQLAAAADVVPGDVVALAEGDIVPADGRLLLAEGLRVDESALTGESVAVDKRVATDGDGAAGVVSAGTTVVHGRGRALVTATGDDSTLGRIARMLDVSPVATPMQRRMAQLSASLAAVVLVGCLLVVGLGLLRGQPLELMVLTGISLAVAAVPESLPVVVTLTLALAARRMAQRRAIVRNLAAVETLGSVTLLATDKTGTLTEGSMAVERLWCAPGADETALLRAGVLCNDARLDGGDGTAHIGDPTEVALLEAARRLGLERDDLAAELPRVAETPFDSSTKLMTTVHSTAAGDRLVVTKGAPESLFGPASRLDDDGISVEAARRAHLLAEEGFRVLAVAEGQEPDRQRLLGLVALHDPPRAAAAATIEACVTAGIRPVLVTGDHPATAATGAGRVGIAAGAGQVVDLAARGGARAGAGQVVDLAALAASGADVEEALGSSVLARATPGQKLDAVVGWQSAGEVVAMTGDGVNDGPALRRADIGVAMGARGTEVARQAADLVLADDELGTVVSAVEEGRRVYANVRRFLLYGLSGGIAELLVMLAGPFAGIALPLLPAQILWVNLLTHSLAGTALGAEPVEAGTMRQPPRDPAEGVLGAGLWWRILVVAAVLAAVSLLAGVGLARSGGYGLDVVRSTVLVVLGAGQLGVALGAGARAARGGDRNPALLATVLAAAALLAAAVLLPPLQVLLGTARLPAEAWALSAAAAATGWACARIVVRLRPRG